MRVKILAAIAIVLVCIMIFYMVSPTTSDSFTSRVRPVYSTGASSQAQMQPKGYTREALADHEEPVKSMHDLEQSLRPVKHKSMAYDDRWITDSSVQINNRDLTEKDVFLGNTPFGFDEITPGGWQHGKNKNEIAAASIGGDLMRFVEGT